MKRDWDLIRIILKKLHDEEFGDIVGYEQEMIDEHINLLQEADLIQVGVSYEDGYTPLNTCRLTWQGHDFIESAANEGLYKQAVQKAKAVGSVSFEIVKAVIAELAKQAIFGPS